MVDNMRQNQTQKEILFAEGKDAQSLMTGAEFNVSWHSSDLLMNSCEGVEAILTAG